MRCILIFICVLAFGASGYAQLTPEEAYAKLQEKKKQREAEANASATQPADPPAQKTSGIQVGRFIHEGWESLLGRRYEDGAKAFDKAVGASPNDAVALEGRGICKYELKDYKAADKDLLKAYNLASVGGPGHVSRQMVIASAAAASENDNPMRGAKIFKETMEALERNGKVDEELQNDLGICLSHANAQAKQSPVFAECLKFYREYDKKLAKDKKDSQARWGTKWIGMKSAEEKWKEYKEASDAVERGNYNLQHAHAAVIAAFSNYTEIRGGLRLHSTAEINQYTYEYRQSLVNQTAAEKQLGRAVEHFKGVEKPPFPERIEHDWEEPR
jgi:tetratricopeptide (TPR) repeat protein